MTIHPTALVDSSAILHEDVTIGPYSVIGAEVELGRGVTVESHVVVKGPSKIGEDVHIYPFAVVGEDTPALAYQGERTTLTVGDRTIIREGVSIHRGMESRGIGTTLIGSDCLLMPNSHVAHDCIVGNRVIAANGCLLAGHVTVGDYANLGGSVGVTQFRSIGTGVHVAAMSLITKDVPAFLTVSGNPAEAKGLNSEGMRRRTFDPEAIAAVKSAYQIVYRKNFTLSESLERIAELAEQWPEVRAFEESISSAQYGIVR